MKYLAITAILCLILAGASFAGNVTMTEVITGGNLTLTMPNNFTMETITLGGADWQRADADSDPIFYVEDSRGSGVGWNLGFAISQFTTGGTNAHTMSADNYYQLEYPPACVYGQSVDETHGPIYVNENTEINIQSSEVKLYGAEAGYGMGKYAVRNPCELWIPASTYAGTYTATLTATLNNVP